VLGHPEGLLDVPELVIRIDDKLRAGGRETGGVPLPPSQGSSLGLQLSIHALGRAGGVFLAIALDQDVSIEGRVFGEA
jgi:hypothetical protein